MVRTVGEDVKHVYMERFKELTYLVQLNEMPVTLLCMLLSLLPNLNNVTAHRNHLATN